MRAGFTAKRVVILLSAATLQLTPVLARAQTQPTGADCGNSEDQRSATAFTRLDRRLPGVITGLGQGAQGPVLGVLRPLDAAELELARATVVECFPGQPLSTLVIPIPIADTEAGRPLGTIAIPVNASPDGLTG